MVVGGHGLIWDVPPSCPVIQPILPNPHLPRQNLAASGMTKIMVNPTNVPNYHCLPVLSPSYFCALTP